MCLSRVFTDTETEEWLADKPEVIEVEKLVVRLGKHWRANIREEFVFMGGRNKANISLKIDCDHSDQSYYSGFHCYLVSEGRKDRQDPSDPQPFVTGFVLKKWITAIGICGSGFIVLVSSQIVMPHYPETEARIEDIPQEIPIKEMKNELV